jgi:hypothetical protein
VLTARSRARLDELADTVRSDHGVQVVVLDRDLAVPGSGDELVAELTARRIAIDILINNAGFGAHGDLVDADPARLDAMTSLNVSTVVGLTTRLLPGMVERKAGAIVNVASTAAFQPVPHMAAYGATKAFVLNFSRAVWAENRTTGVDVLALSPGATDTEFFRVAGEVAAVGARRSTEQVVQTALRALAQGRPSVVDGRRNAFVAWLSPRSPERLSIAIAERSVRPAGRRQTLVASSAVGDLPSASTQEHR